MKGLKNVRTDTNLLSEKIVEQTVFSNVSEARIKVEPDYKGLRILAVDEIAVRKGHKYLAVVLDYLSGSVVFVGKDRRTKTLKTFALKSIVSSLINYFN